MNEIPGLSPPAEVREISAADELRLEEARQLAKENEPKIWKVPLQGALYWVRKNQVSTADWIHGYVVRNHHLWTVFMVILWIFSLCYWLHLLLPR